MSTRVSGGLIATTELKIQLTAGDVVFVLTVGAELGSGTWRYNLSQASENGRNSRLSFGRVIAPDYSTALRHAAVIAGQGYEPGTVERGLFDMLAKAAEHSAGCHTCSQAQTS